jgi:diphthine synthase
VIAQNKQLGLHTLCLLDVKVDQKRCLTIHDALNSLLCLEARKRQRVVTSDSLVVGVSMAGSDNPTIKAGFVGDILKADFGEPPHTLIIPGQLHFTEVEALRVLAGAPESLGETAH